MDNNIKLPDSFSDAVMEAIDKQIAAHEARQEWVTHSIIIAVAVLFVTGLIIMIIHCGWFAEVKQGFDFTALRELFADSRAIMWVIISSNATILLTLYSCFLRRLTKKNQETAQ